MKLQRALLWMVPRPLISMSSSVYQMLPGSPFTSKESAFDSFNTITSRRNIRLKSKLLLLIALMVIGTNMILTHLIFNADNFDEFLQATEVLSQYAHLNRRFLVIDSFMDLFKIPSRLRNGKPYLTKHISQNQFNHNVSTTAFTSYINHVYEVEENPEEYLQKHPFRFHWADWLDLADATPFIESYDELERKSGNGHQGVFEFYEKMCTPLIRNQRASWVEPILFDNQVTAQTDVLNIGVCGSIEKYFFTVLPERVMLETDFHYFTVPVNQTRNVEPLGKEGLTKLYHNTDTVTQQQIDAFNPNGDSAEIVDDLKRHYIEKGFDFEPLKLQPTLSQESSNFIKPDVPKLIKDLQAKKELTEEEQKYLDFLTYSEEKSSNNAVGEFFFTSIRIDVDRQQHELVHYSYPWMKHIRNHDERIKIIHHVIRSWFKFAENAGIVSWFSYGNLYGWYYNSQNLPWDTDLDVQISITDQDKLGRYHNNTLVVENPKLGDHIFFFHTNPWYMNENPNQMIDSRYIEAKSGIYIDISAQWLSDGGKDFPSDINPAETEMIRCKNYQWNLLEDIFPLRRTIFEGAQTYIPHNPSNILHRKYGKESTKKLYNENHNWQAEIGMWIPNQICEKEKIPKERFDENGQLTLHGACNNVEILEGWRRTNEAYERHKIEYQRVVEEGEEATDLTEDELPIFRFFDIRDYQ